MQYFENNENLKSELRTLNYTYENNHFTFYSDLGVFSKDKIDLGSRLLVETYFKYGKKSIKVLDVGCGYGLWVVGCGYGLWVVGCGYGLWVMG